MYESWFSTRSVKNQKAYARERIIVDDRLGWVMIDSWSLLEEKRKAKMNRRKIKSKIEIIVRTKISIKSE